LALMPRPEIRRHEDEKLSEMRVAVAARLKRVCDGMSEQEFDALVLQISQFKIKWGESLIYDNPPALGAWMFGREKGEGKK
jgi:hypothetical protein